MNFLRENSRTRLYNYVRFLFVFLSIGIFILLPAHATIENRCGHYFDTSVQIAVALSEDNIVSGDPMTGIISLIKKNGSLVWSFSTGNNITHLAISDDGNTIGAATNDGDVFGFDSNGTLLWHFTNMGCYPRIQLTCDGMNGYIFNNDGLSEKIADTIHYIDRNGTMLWETRVPGISDAAITRNGTYAVVGTQIGRNSEVRFYINNGTILWQYPAPDGIDLVASSQESNTFAATHSYRLVIFDPSGRILSEIIPKYHPNTLSISHDGDVIITGSQFQIQAFGRNGTLVWQSPENDVKSVALVKDNNTILVGSATNVSWYNQSGKILWRIAAEGGAGSVGISADGSIAAAGLKNSVVYLIDRNRKVRTISLDNAVSSPRTTNDMTRPVTRATGQQTTAQLPFLVTLAALVVGIIIQMIYRR